MRYDKGHKEETRKKIVEIAAREFRRNGINGIGVADVMGQAGLTHGGFYSHFKSKEELVRAALDEASRTSRIRRNVAEGCDFEGIVRSYLRPDHRDHPEKGCSIAALVTDIGRGGRETREQFTESIGRLVEILVEKLPEAAKKRTAAERRKKVLAVLSLLAGTLQLSRTVADPALSEQLLDAGVEAALALSKT